MFWYFLLTITAGIVLFLLGAYSVQVSILINAFKVLIAVAIIAIALYAYKRFSNRKKPRALPWSGGG